MPYALKNNPRIINFKAPLINFSSTEIRNKVRENKEIRKLVPTKVFDFIIEKKFYL